MDESKIRNVTKGEITIKEEARFSLSLYMIVDDYIKKKEKEGYICSYDIDSINKQIIVTSKYILKYNRNNKERIQ